MKKIRGLKRYYDRLQTENDLARAKWLNFSNPDIWFDNWHLHFDWHGLGNKSWKKRKPHLDKLIRHFNLIENKIQEIQKDFQLYAVLFDDASEEDALFIHTTNPNEDNFPFQYKNLQSETTLSNKDLNQFISELTSFEKYFGSDDGNFCVLFKDEVGIRPIHFEN